LFFQLALLYNIGKKQVARISSCHEITMNNSHEDCPYSYDLCWTWTLRMRIEIVVNERHISESSSKRGPKRRLTDSERKRRKRESNAKLSKNTNRIWIGGQCDRWNEFRPVLRLKPTMKWRKFFWTGKCNVYILTMKINRTLWLIEVIILLRRWIHRRKYIFIYHLYLKCMLFTSK